jgi:hypothetical protein
MAINEFGQQPKRTKIAYVGPLADGVAEVFNASRGFELFELNSTNVAAPGLLQQVDSALFFQDESKPSRIGRELRTYAGVLLAHDCRIYIRHLPIVEGEGGDYRKRLVLNAIEEQRLPAHGLMTREHPTYGPVVYIVPSPCNWQDIANFVKNNPAGVGANSTTQIVNGEQLSYEEKLLIQRAFHNCSKIDLIPLGNGMSGVPAYRVYAELQGNVIPSSWPYVYFVKLGNRQAIEKEYYNYRETAVGHVPFHLGPRLKLDRCALGYQRGILVSDFVTGAETLKDCARDGRAATAVGNLFSTTIASWRSGARQEERNLADYLVPYLPTEVPPHRRDLMVHLGAALDLDALKTQLQSIHSQPVLTGVIHGDLHATNVLVRGSDAIIIDFEKIELNMPVLLDAATVEAGLFVDGFIGDRRSGTAVLESVKDLYSVAAINGELLACHPKDDSSWFFDCVRQIRMHARAMERNPNQYALTLACVLAKKACKNEVLASENQEPSRLSREEVRALAMVLAELIFGALFSGRKQSSC